MLAHYTQLEQAFILITIYQVKHFIADFPLQRAYMLQKVKPGWDFVLPLVSHCAVHALLTLLICLLVSPSLWWLAVLDFITHFIMDRIKAGQKYLGRYRDKAQPAYWNCLGFDQMVHHLTHFYIVWKLIGL